MATVGNIVFSFIMMAVSAVLIVESIQEIAIHKGQSSGNDTTNFHIPAIIAVTVAFFVKFCLFCYCWGLRDYPQVLPHVKNTELRCAGPYIMGRS
jgi:protein-S-isoprenylcysteine O-methyltransferase Ste14